MAKEKQKPEPEVETETVVALKKRIAELEKELAAARKTKGGFSL